jgi:hypothetical protein
LSVALLVTGVVGGVYLGQDHQTQQRTAVADQVHAADQAELDLLKERHAEHAAARAPQRAAEADASDKAARQAKAAATKARKLETAVIKKKAAEKKAAEEKAAAKKAAEQAAADGEAEGKPSTPIGPIPASCDEYSGNRAIGCAVLVARGFGMDQMACLDKLWKKESGWNHRASNAGSGAYGIPQALPGRKMASSGSDWRTNPATQIKWGLGYIKGRYNTPCGAWAHSQDVGWY